MNTQNMYLYHQNTVEKKFLLSLKVFITMRKFILMERKLHTDRMVTQIFYVDTEGLLKYEAQNEIRVIARNSDQPNSRWYSGTGIYRPVYLWTGDQKYIPVNGIRIHTVSYAPAVIEVEIKTSCPGTVKVEILDKNQIVLTQEVENTGHPSVLRMEIPDAKLWDCDHPNLYTLRATFGEDVVEETFGIRLLEWNPEKGLTINGKREILRGACVHHDNGVLGACTYPEAEERRVRILKENGYNAIRSSHYPCSKDMLDACDRQGMLMMDEYVDVWYIHKTKYDYAGYLNEWWQQDLKDMVEKDYNHPCVIMYSIGNEIPEVGNSIDSGWGEKTGGPDPCAGPDQICDQFHESAAGRYGHAVKDDSGRTGTGSEYRRTAIR